MSSALIHPLSGPLSGSVVPAADKSITHRALFFAALNHGRTVMLDPSPAADCRSTLELLRGVGYRFDEGPGRWELDGGQTAPDIRPGELDCGNSGTTARLAAGFLTGERGAFTLVGDGSLMARPMERVASPLRTLGGNVTTIDGGLPMTITGAGGLPGLPDGVALDVTSAQVHASLVLAMLRSGRGGYLRRVRPMRDHTLRMARSFGVEIATEMIAGVPVDHIVPARIERDLELRVPGDLSSAAFLIAAAMLVPGSSITLGNVGLNPTRTALLDLLAAMGGELRWSVTADAYEPVGSVTAAYSPELAGVELDEGGPFNVAEMLDELPLLALMASQARGRTVVRGASELRVKESDRIAATARMLGTLGVSIEEHEDGFTVEGGQPIRGGVTVDHHGDHRLCMVGAIAGLIARAPVEIPRPETASVSYPAFWRDLDHLAGGRLTASRGEER